MPNPLPPHFWEAPPDITSSELLTLHAEILEKLRSEADQLPNLDTLQEMLIERVAALYIWIRQKEIDGGWKGGPATYSKEREYKDALKLFADLSGQLLKMASMENDALQMKEAILQVVTKQINAVLDTLHPEIADGLRSSFAEAFEAASL